MNNFALHDAAIFTVDPGNRVIPRGTLIVEDGRISAVGPSDELIIPPGVPVIDVQALFQQYGARWQRHYNVDLIHDDCHPTPLGHQLIAEALAPLLRTAITGSDTP